MKSDKTKEHKMKIMNRINRRWGAQLAGAVLVIVAICGLAGCSTTRQARSVSPSGFLGDYSQLKPGQGDQAKLVYIRPDVEWKRYTKMYIEPVQLWMADKNSRLARLSKSDQQTLINLLYTDLHNQLETSFTLVDQPGSNTLVLRCAITEADKCSPVRNLATTLVPFGAALNLLKTAAFGKGTGVGEAQAEMELLDGVTQERLAAAVDARVGTKALRTKFDGTWGDVRLAFSYWAWKLNARLVEIRADTGKNVDSRLGQ
jgi:hypothetical protein